MRFLSWFGILGVGAGAMSAAGEVRSRDAVAHWGEGRLVLETDAVRIEYRTDRGLTRDTWFARGYGQSVAAAPGPDFQLQIDGEIWSSDTDDWHVGEVDAWSVGEGELRVVLPLDRGGLHVRRHWSLFPGLGLVRSWLTVENRGDSGRRLTSLPIATAGVGFLDPEILWLSGAESFGDSWRMRAEPLGDAPRTFDSFDAPIGHEPMGDGVDLCIRVNGQQAWPEQGWARSRHSQDPVSHDLELDLQAGDRVEFVLARHGNMTCDTTRWDPHVVYGDDGETHQASSGFAADQGASGWFYEYAGDDGQRTDLIYDSAKGTYGERWRRALGVIEPFLSASEAHPDPSGAVVRVFVAPRPGLVRVVGTACNVGNAGPAGPGFRLGSQTYCPWFGIRERGARSGMTFYAGFDCMAHWRAEFERSPDAARLRIEVAGYDRLVEPGDKIRTPFVFMGACGPDLDEMGQEVLEWQYRYMWDYTREPWFPAVRMLGYWMRGTTWGQAGWTGGEPDYESAYRKIFRTVDLMRRVGGDTYHRDWGWWDRAGDWNGPDFRSSGEYLRRHGMGQLIYAFLYTVDPHSEVARSHPGWLVGGSTLDQSLPEVVDYQVGMLERFYRQWGAFQWRNDSMPLSPRDGDETPLVEQEQGFMRVLERFLNTHPDCAFQGVNGGGFGLNWEYLRYASGFQYTDGQSQHIANYYLGYLFPPDKINDMPDSWDPDRYDPARWRGLLCANIDMTGDTFDEARLDGLQELLGIYHYLQARGVAGRWVRVYHPEIEGDDAHWYFLRLSWDRERGVLITKHTIEGEVRIRFKGLIPEHDYEISFQDADAIFSRNGADLMSEGLLLDRPAPGELVYLNLTDHPGNRVDLVPPSAPADVSVGLARHMGVPGVEVAWTPARDDSWLSHYLVFRDGELLDKVAKGTFYFDHSSGADVAAVYEIAAVDGAGNASARVASPARSDLERVRVLDDRAGGIQRVGEWGREPLACAEGGALLRASAAGAEFSVEFRGRRMVWHGRLGAGGGLARVTVDGEVVGTVSCYAADEIPNWPVYEIDWPEPGAHVLEVRALGEPDPRGNGTSVWLDAVSVTP